MRHLTIPEYDANENNSRINASYPALRCFYPVGFGQANFPTRATKERELIRYADIMHETISRREYLEEYKYSEQEVEAILKLVAQVRVITGKLFGRTVQPLMCLFPPLPILRAVEAIASARGRRLTIFEIGPGSGYLGAYLINAGHSYASIDVTQALYLWQNRLFANITTDGSEWALDVGMKAKCIHIPWWHYARFHETLPINADIVICDAAMGEMETFGLFYNLQTARAMVDASDCAAFMFQHIGEERVNKRDLVEHSLAKVGFTGRRIDGVSIYSLAGRLDDVFPSNVVDLPYLGSAGGKLHVPKTFLKFQEAELLESYRFFNYLGYGL